MTPIEAAARAISDAITETPEHWRDWIHEARAAIAAIREPSLGMFMRGGNTAVSNRGKDHQPFRQGPRIGDLAAADAWKAMIDAALAEGPDA